MSPSTTSKIVALWTTPAIGAHNSEEPTGPGFQLRLESATVREEGMLFPDELVVDGQSIQGDSVDLAWLAVRGEVFSVTEIERLISAAEECEVIARDAPGASVELDRLGREQLALTVRRYMSSEVSEESPSAPVEPYPQYGLTIRNNGFVLEFRWSRAVVSADSARFGDLNRELYSKLQQILPSPDPVDLSGPHRLFAYEKVSVAGMPSESESSLLVVRALTRGSVAPCVPDIISGEEPIVAVFSEPSDESRLAESCEVPIYSSGFILEDLFYDLPDAQLIFMRALLDAVPPSNPTS